MSLVNLAHVCSHLQNVSRISKPLASIPYTKLHLQLALGLYKEGFISSIQRGSLTGPDKEFTPATPDNISTRRLWLGMKYHNTKPVLSQVSLVSKPSRRIILDAEQVGKLLNGVAVRHVPPPQLGEAMFIRTDNGEVLEIQEAFRRELGGELLVRAK